MEIAILSWIPALFKKFIKESPTQSITDSPEAQQAQTAGDDSPVAQSADGHAVITGDNSPVTIGATQPTAPVSITPSIYGRLKGPSIVIEIENPDNHEHEFFARLLDINAEGLASDSPKFGNLAPVIMCDRERIGPKQKGELLIGQIDGGSKRNEEPYKTIHLFYIDSISKRPSRHAVYMLLGSVMTCQIEVQTDALLDQPLRYEWELQLESEGTPISFARKP